MRIRDVYPVSRSEYFPSRIQGHKDSGSRIQIRIKEFKYFIPKNCSLSSRKYDPGCSSRIRIWVPDLDLDFYPSWIPNAGDSYSCHSDLEVGALTKWQVGIFYCTTFFHRCSAKIDRAVLILSSAPARLVN